MKRAAIVFGKICLVILSVILCIALFATTLVTMLVADVQVATNKDNLANLLKQALYAPAQHMTIGPVTAAAGSDFQFDFSGNLSGQLVEYAYNVMAEESGGTLTMSLEAVQNFVEDSTLKDFLAEKAASIISDVYTGENTTTITGEEITQLLTENTAVIKEHFDVEIPQEAVAQIAQLVEEIPVVKQIQEQGVTAVILGNDNPADPEWNSGSVAQGQENKTPFFPDVTQLNSPADILNAVRAYTSTAALLICIGACAVLIGLLFLCAWNKPYKAMIYAGVPVFLAGTLFLVPTLIAWLSPATWAQLFSFEPMVGMLSRFILMLTGGVCGTVTFLGIALFVGGIVLGVYMRKRRMPKEVIAEEAAPELESAEETPAEEVPAEEAPAEEAPAEEAASEQVPAAEETV